MAELVAWANRATADGLPVPLIAAIVHYQFVTIHPFYDGNGRTGRLLATYILHRSGYGLHGVFSLEEHHARDLEAYYRALAVHPHHNYYHGRADADLTPWVEYFLTTLARVFALASEEASRHAAEVQPEPEELRRLDRRARVVLGLFAGTERVTTNQVAAALGLSDRMARVLLNNWVNAGWLVVADPSRRTRSYSLSAMYRQFIGNASAER
jgi:Fic family protein